MCEHAGNLLRDYGPYENNMKSYVNTMRRIAITIHFPTIYFLIPVSGCVSKGPSALHWGRGGGGGGGYNIVKMALHPMPFFSVLI